MTGAARIAILRLCLAGLVLAAEGGCASPPAAPPSPGPAPAPAPAPPAEMAPAPALPARQPRPGAGVPRYRCDHELAFTVSYGDDTATLEIGARGREVLLRDAGGVTPQQTVYSNEHLRAEFGLGAAGNEAVLRFAEPPLVAHCARE
jgi:hypothetical protein